MTAPRPKLVMAHYFGGSARSWRLLLEALGGEYPAAAPDLAGFGGTPTPDMPSLDAYADALIALAGEDDWIAVGHSMGGKIALMAAARRPAGLKGLILIAPSPPTPEPMSENDRQERLDAFADRAAAIANIDKLAPGLSPALREQAVESDLNVAHAAWTWWLQTGSREDISTATNGLTLPVLIVTGDADKAMALETPFGVGLGLANSEVRVIEGGHLLPLEQPVALAEVMRGFLAALE